MAQVTFKNVEKFYDKLRVVKNLNLEISDGEFMVLVGPSGCGKSTTLRMIAGLEEVSGGDVYIGDHCVNTVAPRDRDIAMVFQNYALYPHMSVFDNMAFGLKLRKYSKSDIETRVREASDILGLQDLLNRKPKALSGGQRQRVALGRAIVRKPKVFLFDEPLSNLDAKLRVQMRIEISKLHQRLQTTMIYVTHDQTEAMTMGDRITVMHEGEVQQVDEPLNLYEKPHNHFVAGFIGSPAMNFFEGNLSLNTKSYSFKSTSWNFPLPSDLNIESPTETEVILGIRPENVALAPYGPENKTAMIQATVEVVEPMGNELFVYLNHREKLFIMRCDPAQTPQVSQSVEVFLNPVKVHLFDKNNGKSIIHN
jgi:multiple sugar transport system ATP-binding protein